MSEIDERILQLEEALRKARLANVILADDITRSWRHEYQEIVDLIDHLLVADRREKDRA